MKRLLLLLLLVACASEPMSVNPYVGTHGLGITFTENAPPPRVYEESAFPVRIAVKNLGASAISSHDMKFMFSWDPLYIDSTLKELNPYDGSEIHLMQLSGKSASWPTGQSKVYSVPGQHSFSARKILGTIETPKTTLQASVCYKYNTLLTENVCIDTNTYEENLRKQVCKGKDLELSGGQGAPIAVTKVEVEAYPIYDGLVGKEAVRPTFTIHMANQGGGRLLGPDTLSFPNVCYLQGVPQEELGAVRVDAWLLGTPLECFPNPAQLFLGEGQTRCTVSEAALGSEYYNVKQNFLTTLSVNLTYFYSSKATREIAIERTGIFDLESPFQERVPGYVYEGDRIVKKDDGSYLTVCESYANGGGSGNNPILEGWSCSCTVDRCLKIARITGVSTLGCDLSHGICPEPMRCCGPTPEFDEEE